jgi:peptidoglycan/xylan/chitin deacetylase (PgdA/CDA1 family)
MPSFREHREMLALWERFPALERLEPGDGRLALTFDDGPDREGTPHVLDALDAVGAKATFFLLGEQLMRDTALGREVAARGHEIALHGFGHAHHEDLTPQQARDDLARGLGAAEAATGHRPLLYRPPYGRFSEHSYEACRALDLRPVYWTAWGQDWDTLPAERIAELVVRDLADGAIVLLHDSSRYADRPSAEPTAAALTPVAAQAIDAGLTLVTLSDALSTRSAAS